MKVKYLAAVAAASVLGLTTLTSCGPEAEVEPEATEEIAPDEAMEPEADPCAADPCAAEPEG